VYGGLSDGLCGFVGVERVEVLEERLKRDATWYFVIAGE
jgi:hypothetical protein